MKCIVKLHEVVRLTGRDKPHREFVKRYGSLYTVSKIVQDQDRVWFRCTNIHPGVLYTVWVQSDDDPRYTLGKLVAPTKEG